MNTSSIVVSSTVYTAATLEDTPRRALELLRGIGSSPAILKLMMQAGYSEATHEEGQHLLANVVSFIDKKQASTSSAHVQATAALELFERTVFRRLRAVTDRFFPDHAEELFGSLEISDEMDAALLVKVFLERLALLNTSKTRKGPSHIAKVFADRGFGHAEIRALENTVQDAAGSGTTGADAAAKTEAAAMQDTRMGMLTNLRAWYDDWSETARVVLDRRDHLIRCGLARRKVRAPAAVTVPVTPAAPAAIVTPVMPATPAPIVAPLTPAVPVAPAAIVTPVTPLAPAAPAITASPAAPVQAPTTPGNDNVIPIVKVA